MTRFINRLMLWTVVGLLAGALAESAHAQTIVINGTGSPSGLELVASAPIAMCLNSPRPIHLQSGPPGSASTSDRHTWICNVTYAIPALGINFINRPVVIRYSASESGLGFTKLTGQYGSSPEAPYIDETDLRFCAGPLQRTVGALTFDEYVNCSRQVFEPVHFGASDVQAGSFGQIGPTGVSFPPDCVIGFNCGQPVNESTLSSETVAALPFALFVNNGVRLQTAAGTLGAPLDNLTRPQIEALFRRNVKNWNELGYLVTSNGTTPNPVETGVTLCLRDAGAGSKAAFDETQMLQSSEAVVVNGTVNGTGGRVHYFPNDELVLDCLFNNVNGIGYLYAARWQGITPIHPIQIDGASANYAHDPANPSPIHRKRDIACGRYTFWTDWRIIRTTSQSSTLRNDLIRALADAARVRAASLTHWVAPAEMSVSKPADAGPISFNGTLGDVPPNPECRP